METKCTASPFALAVLSEQINASNASTDEIGFASLSLQQSNDGWWRLLPAGHFKAVDGRPFDVPSGHWFLDEPTAQLLIAELTARVNPSVIDYEHQTLATDQNGQPAPASGWFKNMEWRSDGLWIKPDWTERASGFIAAKEYRFLSAVFPYDKQNGKPISLHSVALTNKPGLDGLNSAALRSLRIHPTQKEEPLMDLKKLLAALGLSGDTTEETALAALTALKTKADAADSVSTELAALKANPPTAPVDPAQYVPIAALTAMQTQIATLSAQVQTGGLDKLIEDAKNEGKLLPAMESWARDLGNKDVAALTAYLDKATPIAALKSQQAGNEKPPGDKNNKDELSEDDMAVLKATGLSKEDYLAARA